MRIDKAGDLVFWTYYMMDWEKVRQGSSTKPCMQCGRTMNTVETVTDRRGLAYEGLVCHSCKRLLWVKRDWSEDG
ncbi:MAG TPA: hypothetical protein VK114_01990 [Nitrososphaerales archaeon]|nr:hypothetical protein [Nitrososphaerales archaeon]